MLEVKTCCCNNLLINAIRLIALTYQSFDSATNDMFMQNAVSKVFMYCGLY